jgi:hypothetical protein
MKGHVGAVLTSGIAAMALALMVLFALILVHPMRTDGAAAADVPSRSTTPWTPVSQPPSNEQNSKPREHHRVPPRNRPGFPDQGPRAPRRAAA